MLNTRRQFRRLKLLLTLAVFTAVAIGAATGIFLAQTRNVQRQLDIGAYTPALPSLLLDRRGKLISSYFAEEKREIVKLNELPMDLVYALIAKEDRTFYRHIGFSVKGFVRAAWNIITGNYFSGGSTISQQVAGNLYEDREDETIGRKLKELFWSIQLERQKTKDEIIEIYFNFSSFGHGTYGVEAAAQFYFGHSARDVSLAESAMLVVQLARINSMLRNPNRAKIVQRATLDAMVDLGYASREDADSSFDEFWRSYDLTRSNLSTAYTERYDEAPYFSEYVRRAFEAKFYGPNDLYRDGYIIHTTLDLEYQRAAEAEVGEARDQLNAVYRDVENRATVDAERSLVPLAELLGLTFSIDGLDITKETNQRDAFTLFEEKLMESMEAVSLILGDQFLYQVVSEYRLERRDEESREDVEGALVTLDNENGYILAMVGGSDFASLSFNLAVDSRVSPGSSAKPLYYAAGIEAGTITPSTMFYDSPAVFYSDINPPYTPENFLGAWSGPVSVRWALSNSMNVPSIKVLELLGLERAIASIAALLGLEEKAGDRLSFPRVFPIGLGTFGTSPLQMASAYAVFARSGKSIEPFAIRYIEDRNGTVFYDNEKEVLQALSKRKNQLSPQTAYVMTDLLQSTVTRGTLARRVAEAGGLGPIPMAGKTGTTDNWSDAWTVGYSPFVTTAVWFGFVIPGNSLGRYQTGALAAGPVWVSYMKDIHEDLPYRDFPVPENGILTRQVCAISGLLPTEQCTEG
ncbi:MAG: PBP1A family penicillin-binding protein, partial [Spirochaetales bacterium]|nr:PBP1A family penicillin-binding protein [Spirochaetales bacterium]